MALPPRFAGQLLPTSPVHHTLEISAADLDYACPFSAKIFQTLHPTLTTHITNKYPTKLRLIFRQQIQPWHPSSTLLHESALAVLKLAPTAFWDYSAALFAHQRDYFDVNVVNESRNQTYVRLARLARESVGVDEEGMMALLRVSDQPGEDGALNTGNRVTDDLKGLVKAARVVGVHVSPTVFFDGVEERGIGSSWTREQWVEWLERNVT